MNSKMVVRILSICMALLFLGMVAPCLAFDPTTPTSLDFGEVTVGITASDTLTIHNPNPSYPMNVTLSVVNSVFNGELGVCGFSVEPAQLALGGGGSGDATVSYAPTATNVGSCEADISVYYGRGAPILVHVTGTGAAAGPKTVIIDGEDTGVENKAYQGETVSYWLDALAAEARNHGQYVRGVALMLRKMHKADVLSRQEVKVIMKAAAHANIPLRKSGLEDLVYNGEPVTDLIEGCKEEAANNKDFMRCVHGLMKEMKKEGVIESRKQKHQIRKYAARLRFHDGHKRK